MPEPRRLFVAVTLEPAAREALYGLGRRLVGAGVRGRFTAPDNLHLTLVFLGETDNEAGARRAVDSLRRPPFAIWLDGLGTFAKRGGDVLWAGVQTSGELAGLQSALAAALRAQGFAAEDRPYRPHVTLARQARMPAGLDLAAFCAGALPLHVPVRAASLMESLREDGRLVYRPIYQKRLTEGS